MNNLDVSVIIPCYNAEATLFRSIKSVVDQTAKPNEIIIIDDGSVNSIEPLVKKWASEISIPIRLITQVNLGAPSARNAGLQIAKSKYVAFLDADDIWLPEKLQIQYSVMTAENLNVCGHGYQFEYTETFKLQNDTNIEHLTVKKISLCRFAFGNPFFTPTVMVLRESFVGFDSRFLRVDDYKAWVDSYRQNKYGIINLVLAAGFKNPIGQSGLTSSIQCMHNSYLEVLLSLLSEHKINFYFYVIARLVEAFKLPIRRYRALKVNK